MGVDKIDVGVIGTGVTGSTIAVGMTRPLNYAEDQLVGKIDLYNRQSNSEFAKNEAVKMDVKDASQFTDTSFDVNSVESINALLDNDVIVISAKGKYDVNQLEGDKRKEGLKYDLPIFKEIGHKIQGYDGNVIVVSNPADVVARILAEESGLDPYQIYSFGASLDNARVKSVLYEEGYDPRKMYSEFVGEHGPSGVIRFSQLKYEGENLRFEESKRQEIEEKVRMRGYSIVSALGTSAAGPANGVHRAIHNMYKGGVELLGHPIEVGGSVEYVYAATPVQFNSDGFITDINYPEISDDPKRREMEKREKEAFEESVSKIEEFTKEAI